MTSNIVKKNFFSLFHFKYLKVLTKWANSVVRFGYTPKLPVVLNSTCIPVLFNYFCESWNFQNPWIVNRCYLNCKLYSLIFPQVAKKRRGAMLLRLKIKTPSIMFGPTRHINIIIYRGNSPFCKNSPIVFPGILENKRINRHLGSAGNTFSCPPLASGRWSSRPERPP